MNCGIVFSECGKLPREKTVAVDNHALTRAERAQLVQLGANIYRNLKAELEERHLGEYAAISVLTGRYIATSDDAKLMAFAKSLDKGDFLYMTRVEVQK